MLVRVRHSPALALGLAQFAGLVSAEDFIPFRAALTRAQPSEPMDQILCFDAHALFEPGARTGFQTMLDTANAGTLTPVAISVALVAADAKTKSILEDWAHLPPNKCCIVAAAFNSLTEAASWTGLDASGVEAVRALRGFDLLYQAPGIA